MSQSQLVVLHETLNGVVQLEWNGVYQVLRFDGPCAEMLPYCQAMCCRVAHTHSVILQPDEVGRFKSRPHPAQPGKFVPAITPAGACVYLGESSYCKIHQDKPMGCGAWHCSPGGKNSDGSEPLVKSKGWFLSPAGGNEQDLYGADYSRLKESNVQPT